MGYTNKKENIISNNEKNNLNIGKWTLLFLINAIIAFYFYNFFNSKLTQESVAQFGDYLGGVLNPIFGFATIGLLVWSIQIQLRELKLTRIEMEENTKANIEQAKELKEQNDLLREQHDRDTNRLKIKELDDLLNEQQTRIEKSLDIPVGIITDNSYSPTFSDLLYKSNSYFQESFETSLRLNPELLLFSKKQLKLAFTQYITSLSQLISGSNSNSISNIVQVINKLEWIYMLVNLCVKRKIIGDESIKALSKLIIIAINKSDYFDSVKEEMTSIVT